MKLIKLFDYLTQTDDLMAYTFRPIYSEKVETITSNTGNTVKIRKVLNSKFNLYAEATKTKRSKSVRLTESLLNDIYKILPNGFELPNIVVINFSVFGIDAIGGYARFTNTMFISSKYNTKNKILKYINQRAGFFANKTIYAPLLHELGHKYYYAVIEKYSIQKNISYNEAEQITKDKIADYVHKYSYNRFFLERNLSRYAQDGYRQGKYGEIIAEGFSAMDSNDIAKEIMESFGGILL